MKNTFNRKEVIDLIKFYCRHQRILCQLPVPFNQFGITKEINEAICNKIRIDADIDRFLPLKKQNFQETLNKIKKSNHKYGN